MLCCLLCDAIYRPNRQPDRHPFFMLLLTFHTMMITSFSWCDKGPRPAAGRFIPWINPRGFHGPFSVNLIYQRRAKWTHHSDLDIIHIRSRRSQHLPPRTILDWLAIGNWMRVAKLLPTTLPDT